MIACDPDSNQRNDLESRNRIRDSKQRLHTSLQEGAQPLHWSLLPCDFAASLPSTLRQGRSADGPGHGELDVKNISDRLVSFGFQIPTSA